MLKVVSTVCSQVLNLIQLSIIIAINQDGDIPTQPIFQTHNFKIAGHKSVGANIHLSFENMLVAIKLLN